MLVHLVDLALQLVSFPMGLLALLSAVDCALVAGAVAQGCVLAACATAGSFKLATIKTCWLDCICEGRVFKSAASASLVWETRVISELSRGLDG